MDTDLAARRRAVRNQILNCIACPLRKSCEAPVPFTGPSDAVLTIIGEAPGRQEDREGKPFVGPSGRYLRSLLATHAGLDASQLFFFNTIACRPMRNADPTPSQLAACSQNFADQFALTTSRFILLAGRFAFNLFRPHEKLSAWHGVPFWREGRVLFPVHHPARVLRDGDDVIKRELEQDVENLAAIISAPDLTKFWPDRCMACSKGVESYDAEGVGWCSRHREAGSNDNVRLFEVPTVQKKGKGKAKTKRRTEAM